MVRHCVISLGSDGFDNIIDIDSTADLAAA